MIFQYVVPWSPDQWIIREFRGRPVDRRSDETIFGGVERLPRESRRNDSGEGEEQSPRRECVTGAKVKGVQGVRGKRLAEERSTFANMGRLQGRPRPVCFHFHPAAHPRVRSPTTAISTSGEEKRRVIPDPRLWELPKTRAGNSRTPSYTHKQRRVQNSNNTLVPPLGPRHVLQNRKQSTHDTAKQAAVYVCVPMYSTYWNEYRGED